MVVTAHAGFLWLLVSPGILCLCLTLCLGRWASWSRLPLRGGLVRAEGPSGLGRLLLWGQGGACHPLLLRFGRHLVVAWVPLISFHCAVGPGTP